MVQGFDGPIPFLFLVWIKCNILWGYQISQSRGPWNNPSVEHSRSFHIGHWGYDRWADASQQQVAKSQYQLEKEVRQCSSICPKVLQPETIVSIAFLTCLGVSFLWKFFGWRLILKDDILSIHEAFIIPPDSNSCGKTSKPVSLLTHRCGSSRRTSARSTRHTARIGWRLSMPLSTALPPSSTSETPKGWDRWDGMAGFNGPKGWWEWSFNLWENLSPQNQQQLPKIFSLAGSPHLPLYFQRSNAASYELTRNSTLKSQTYL